MNNCPEASQRKREQSQPKGLTQERKPFTLGKQAYPRARTTVTRIDPILSLCLHNVELMGHSLTVIHGAGNSSVFITDEEIMTQEQSVELSRAWKLGSLTLDPYCKNTWAP